MTTDSPQMPKKTTTTIDLDTVESRRSCTLIQKKNKKSGKIESFLEFSDYKDGKEHIQLVPIQSRKAK